MKSSYRFSALIMLSLSVIFIHTESFSETVLDSTARSKQESKQESSPDNNNNYESQRKIYIEAEKLLRKSYSAKYESLEKNLVSYPLYPYLQQKELLLNLSLKNKEFIGNFLNQYENTPLDWPLRKKWLNYLIKKKRYQLYVDFYKPNNDARMTCLYYKSQFKLGVSENEILPKITPLWLIGKSQPKDCDALFVRWAEAGYRTNELILQRLILAATIGKHTLIPYLTKLLPEDSQYLGKLWHRMRRDPSLVTRLNIFPKKNEQEAEIMTYGLRRFIWRDPNRAIKAYNKAKESFTFSLTQEQKIITKFSLALASKKHKSASFWLQKVNDENLTSNLIQWRIADALRTADWDSVKTVIQALPSERSAENKWQYWLARGLMETDEVEAGELIFHQLAKKRHYYGFLASGYFDQAVALQENALVITAEERTKTMQYPAAKRAFELFHLKRFVKARREWNYLFSEITPRQQLVIAKLANEIGWYDRAIFTLADVGYLDDIDLRFPKAYKNHIDHYSKVNNISSAWVFAIARRESSFMEDANSSAGARGLLQVLPSTAKQYDKRKKSNQHLYDPKSNIRIATQYLSYKISHHNNIVLATAAYNAGSYRIKTWLKNQPSLPADIWIETIPYKETREYVKSVLTYKQIYLSRDNDPSKTFTALSQMKIGGY
ncbi:MAG: soluble lytic murein transglycosylase [Enterobacterales bacterium]|jgi:soluble lytic murein transglycosylase